MRVRRIGLTTEQVDDLTTSTALAIEVKPSDSRAKRYIEEYGNRCWEADVLPAAVIEAAIDSYIRSWLDGKLRKQRPEIERARKLL